jgi:hypothetical protein
MMQNGIQYDIACNIVAEKMNDKGRGENSKG